MRTHNALLLLVAAFTLASCGPKDAATNSPDTKGSTPSIEKPGEKSAPSGNLEGTWTVEEAAKNGATMEFTFSADGTFVNAGSIKEPSYKSPITTKMEGTFAIRADAITMHINSMVASCADPSSKSMLDGNNMAAKDSLAKDPELAGKLAWKDANSVTLTFTPKDKAAAAGAPMTLKRKS